MNTISGIYKVKNIVNGKIYIGQSKDIHRRWKEHIAELNRNSKSNKHLQNAWNKYSEENFEFKIIETCPENQLNKREIYFINKYNSFNSKYGYNKTTGGGQGRIMSDETRAILVEINKDIHIGEKNSFSKYKESEIRLCKMLLYCYMKPEEISDITKIPSNYIGKIKRGEVWSHVLKKYNQDLATMSDLEPIYQSRPVIMFDKVFKNSKTYKNATEAARDNGFSISTINSCCHMKVVKTHERVFLFNDEHLTLNIKKKKLQMAKNKEFIVHMIDSKGKIIDTCDTASEMGRKYNVDASSILKVCNGTRNSTGGLLFKREYIFADSVITDLDEII